MIPSIRTLYRLHCAGRLEQGDWLFLLNIAGILVILAYLLGMVLWAIGAPVYDCWRSPDCWGGM